MRNTPESTTVIDRKIKLNEERFPVSQRNTQKPYGAGEEKLADVPTNANREIRQEPSVELRNSKASSQL
jgi:hypothetical protein